MNKKLLYHYKPLTTLDHLSQLHNYINQKIWFTRLDQFNDLFEAQFYMKFASPEDILRDRILFDRYFCYYKKSDPALTEKSFRSALNGPDKVNFVPHRQLVTDFFSSHGVICFAKSGTNIPMWAHYANNHQGYCIVFEIDLDFIYEHLEKGYREDPSYPYSRDEFDKYIACVFEPESKASQEVFCFSQPQDDGNKHFIFTKVFYQNKKPIINEIELEKKRLESDHERYKYLSQNSFGVKFKEWEYEQEYRLTVNANSKDCGLMHLKGYPFIKITGIIMGYKIGNNLSQDALDFLGHLQLEDYDLRSNNPEGRLKEHIVKLAAKHEIEIYQAECSDEEYRVEKKLISC